MNKVTHIYKSHGGQREYNVRIGNVVLVIPDHPEAYFEPDEGIAGYLPNMGRLFHFWIGQEIHNNKLEVLKSEFEYNERSKNLSG